MHSFSIKESIRFAWEKFKTQPAFLIAIIITPQVFQALLNIVTGGPLGKENPVFAGLLMFVVFVVTFILSIGIIKVYLKVESGQEVEYREIAAHGNLFFKYLFGSILRGLITIGGLILFIIPGIYFAIRLSPQPALIIDKGLGPVDSIKEAWRMTKGEGWHLLKFGLVLILLNIVGLLALVVGLLVTTPVTLLASLHVYRKLLGKTVSVPVV